MEKAILFVDDEKQILKSIRRLFLDSDFTVYTAGSGEEALKLMEDIKIDLIVADMRMPVMDGYELLQKVKQKYPSTVRLILSGYAEEKLIISALKNNMAKIYLFKPWENNRLVRIIEQALEVEQLISSEIMQKILSPIEDELFSRIEAYESCKTAYELIAMAVGNGTSESHILEMMNSSFYDVQFQSIDEGIDCLEEFNIRNLVLAGELFETLSRINPSVNKELMLKYSTLSNKITDLIYKRLLNKDLDEMNKVAGLLHDIGRFLLVHDALNNQADSMDLDLIHQELGGYILNQYGFTYPVIESALFHHTPMDSRLINKEIVAIVHLAASYAGEATGMDNIKSINEGIFEYLGFSKEQCDSVVDEIAGDLSIDKTIAC